MTSLIEAQKKGAILQKRIVDAIASARENSARTQQSKARVLGMSDLGGCREFIRATIAGEPRGPVPSLKWAAEVGTAIGDHVEGILGFNGFQTQETVVLKLPRTGIEVTGHLDEKDVVDDSILDNKTVDGLADVMREGPSFKNKVQISGYLVAEVQTGGLTPEATGHLVYFDRSGKQGEPYVWSLTYEMALQILDAAEERLLDVQHALATGTRNGRDGRLMTDEPESWCRAIQCPFYAACWDGYQPTGDITHEREIDAVRRRLAALADVKDATSRSESAKQDLRGVEGVVKEGPHKGTVVKWTISDMGNGRMSERLEVRPPK